MIKEIYNVKLQEFEGPLDLLLELVKSYEIDIYSIPIAEITKQYLEYLEMLIELDIDNISDFIDIASTLILIKSRNMLPVDNLEFDEDSDILKKGLIEKILEYQQYKLTANNLEKKFLEDEIVYKKERNQYLFEEKDLEESKWVNLSVIDLLNAFSKVFNNRKGNKTISIERYQFTVEEKIEFLKSTFATNDSFNFFDLINTDMGKFELISTFLAILELVKQGLIVIKQHVIFGEIHIFKVFLIAPV